MNSASRPALREDRDAEGRLLAGGRPAEGEARGHEHLLPLQRRPREQVGDMEVWSDERHIRRQDLQALRIAHRAEGLGEGRVCGGATRFLRGRLYGALLHRREVDGSGAWPIHITRSATREALVPADPQPLCLLRQQPAEVHGPDGRVQPLEVVGQ